MIGPTPAAAQDWRRPTDQPEETRTASSDPAGAGAPPGLRAQLSAFKDAVLRLARAHLDLARAELDQILDEVKRLAGLAAVAIGAFVLLGLFVPIGLALFLGDWLFGSLGWGLVHGSLLLVAIVASAGLAAVGVSGGSLGRSFVGAILIGLVIGALLAFDQPNIAWTKLGESIGLGVDPGIRPLVVGIAAGALAAAILGAALGAATAGGGAAIGGLFAGAVLGAIVGAFSAITFGVQAGAAVGVTAGLVSWPILAAIGLARTGIDGEAIKARFWPSVTVETSKETVEWIRGQIPLGPKP